LQIMLSSRGGERGRKRRTEKEKGRKRDQNLFKSHGDKGGSGHQITPPFLARRRLWGGQGFRQKKSCPAFWGLPLPRKGKRGGRGLKKKKKTDFSQNRSGHDREKEGY